MSVRLMILVTALFSQQSVAVDFPIQITEYLDDEKFVVFINESDIEEALPWDAESGRPALSMSGALGAVRQHLAADGGGIDAELLAIELKQIPHHPNHWHYLVKMMIRDEDEQAPAYFVVLMNAKLMPALAMPESLR